MRWLVTLLLIALASTTAWLWLALERERERSAELERLAVASLGADVRVTEAPPAGPTLVPDSAGADDHTGFEPERYKRAVVLTGRDPRLAGNQAYMDARRRYLEASFDQRYPELTRVLGVTEQIALRVVELSYEEQIRSSGIAIDEASGRDFWAEQQQKAFDSDVAIAALIGDAKLAQWKEYQSSIMERHQVRDLRLELMDTAEPLDGEKAELLVRALFEGRQRAEQEANALSGTASADSWQGPTLLPEGNASVDESELRRQSLAAAKKVLSSFQYDTFREIVERQRASQEGLDEMFRLGMKALQ